MSTKDYHPPGFRKIKGHFIGVRNGKVQNLSGKAGILCEEPEARCATLIVERQKITMPTDRLVKPRGGKNRETK